MRETTSSRKAPAKGAVGAAPVEVWAGSAGDAEHKKELPLFIAAEMVRIHSFKWWLSSCYEPSTVTALFKIQIITKYQPHKPVGKR